MTLTKVALPNNKSRAIEKLFDSAGTDRTTAKIKAELPVFQYYLNVAVTNIQELAGLDSHLFKPKKVKKALETKDDSVIQRLADFLWLFKLDNPGQDFPDYKEKSIMLVKQIFMLRNFFCHPEEGDIAPLVVNQEFYHFFAGWALGEARVHSLEGGVKSDRIFKMNVMNAQDVNDDDKTKNTYSFTRRGIVMLVCMALYKDETTEFCQSLKDMKLPNIELDDEDTVNDAEQTELRKKASIRKAYHLVMSYFSQKRSYNAIDQENRDFVSFTDIIGYLNKVPSVCMDYLALNDERKMLADLEAQSTESEDNKRFKYTLHRRMKDRFLSFAAAYCEDFNILPSIHFKRLDISDKIGRKRYIYGVENDNSVRQSRHYAIEKDAIRFEYRPANHYGDIHIDHLRSAISASEFKRLLLTTLSTRTGKFNAAEALDAYFSAYHKVLEKMLNEHDCDFIDRTGYLPELVTITGASQDALMDNTSFLEKMRPFFPENLTRFFIPRDNIPANDILLKQLLNAAKNEIARDEQFIKNMDGAAEWAKKYADVEPEKRPRKPQEYRMNDGAFIAKVFALLNLYLPDNRKFRQLPRGKQHRNCMDFEYQTLHAIIGRFSKEPQDLWDYLMGVKTIYRYEGRKKFPDHTVNIVDSKRRPELFAIAEKLCNKEREFFGKEKNLLQKHPRYDSNGRPIRPMHSLQMLARAAVLLHKDFCQRILTKYNSTWIFQGFNILHLGRTIPG